MYTQLYQTLQLDRSHLSPYMGSDLQHFNSPTSKPWGYVELMVTFRIEAAAQSLFPNGRFPVSLQLHPGKTNIGRANRCALHGPPQDEVLHEEGLHHHHPWRHPSLEEMFQCVHKGEEHGRHEANKCQQNNPLLVQACSDRRTGGSAWCQLHRPRNLLHQR